MRIRTRRPGYGTLKGVAKVYYPNGVLAGSTTSSINVFGKETMTDSTHGPRPKGKYRRIVDWGGEMFRSTIHWDLSRPETVIDVPRRDMFTGRRTYRGYWLPTNLWSTGYLVVPSDAFLTGMGTKGIALSSPTRPQAGLTQFIAELKDLPKAPILSLYRSLAKGGRKKDFIRRAKRGAGHEYLNLEFGWRPLLQDMKDFHKSAMNASKTIDQYLRDSGRVVRRRRILFDETTSGPIAYSTIKNIGVGPTSDHLAAIEGTRTSSVNRKTVWFSGSFTYYITAGDSWFSTTKRNEQILSKLAGTRFGIDTLWELTPWSWALDWVGNIGDVARNLAAFSSDGLVLHYAYLMYNETDTEIRTLRARNLGTGKIDETALTCRRELKIRKRATPFGFGLTWMGFSARQLAIVAALGLSRTP